MATDTPKRTLNREINMKGWLESITSDISFYDSFLDLIDNAVDSVHNKNSSRKEKFGGI